MKRIIIDVREPYEFASGHVGEAVNIPATQIMNGTADLRKISKDAKLILYCNSGSRSGFVSSLLNKIGYDNVTNGINIDNLSKEYDIK